MCDVETVKKKKKGNQWRNKAEQTAIKDNSLESSDGSSDSSESEVLFYERKTQSLLCEVAEQVEENKRKETSAVYRHRKEIVVEISGFLFGVAV